jgi:hypothetical protein
MKNALSYYYNLTPVDIHQYNKQFKFTINQDKYVLMPYERNVDDINYLYEIAIQLFQSQIYCHQFVFNTSRSLLTYINNEPYVLLKVYVDDNSKIILNDIINFGNNSQTTVKNILKRDNWFQLWSDKIDYFEYQISQFGKKYPIIRKSFSYFVGLAETGIMLHKNVNNSSNNTLFIGHKRIKKNYTIFDLYNPLNFIIDLKVRDASEFFKEKFFENHDTLAEVIYYISYANLTSYDCLMLYTRLLFPSFYFDIYEEIINEGKDEENLLPILEKVDDYEQFLKDLYIYLKEIINIPDIEWLKKT